MNLKHPADSWRAGPAQHPGEETPTRKQTGPNAFSDGRLAHIVMDYRKLGSSDLKVSCAGLGCSRIAGSVGGGETKDALWILHRAFDCGINFFDTADIYGQGASEILLARAFAGRRSEIVLATKGGYRFSPAAGWLSKLKPLARKLVKLRPNLVKSVQRIRSSQISQDFSRASLIRALEGSLKRLRTDYIDLYQLHSPPLEVLQQGEVFATMDSMKNAGKIRYCGVACLDPCHALTCLDKEVAAVQVELNFVQPDGLVGVVPRAQPAGIGVIARQPLASGKLLKPPSELTAEDFGGDEDAAGRISNRLARLARLGPLPELALRYLSQKSGVDCVLFGTTRLANLEKNLAALNAPALSRAEVLSIESAILPMGDHNVH